VNGLVKRNGEQEAEQDLGAGDEGAQLVEQFAVLALESFFDRFVFGSFPESLLDHFVGGHGCPSTRGLFGLYAKPGSALLGGLRGRWRRRHRVPVGRPHVVPRW
jgi:hypothetical protein